MKKQLVIAIAAGAASILAYVLIRNKYLDARHKNELAVKKLQDVKSKKHHLTYAFANAKKHTQHASQN